MPFPSQPIVIRWSTVIPWLLIAAVFCALLYALSDILAPFALGAVLAYLCNPLVVTLEKRRVPRTWGSLLAVVLLALVILLLVLLVVPLVWREVQLLLARLPQTVNAIQNHLLPWLSQHLGIHLQLDADTLRAWVSEHWSKAGEVFGVLVGHASSQSGAVIGWIVDIFLVPIAMFYMLLDWPKLISRIENLIPRPLHHSATHMLREIDALLSELIRGQLSVMLTLAVYYSVALWIAGVDFPLPVGILTGLLVFIPFVGYGLGLTLAVLVAVLQFQGWPPIVGVAVVYALGQVLENLFLTPRLVGKRIGLHPLAVIFALMAFGELFGFTGVLVALPVCAAGVVAMRALRSEYFASPLYLGDNTSTPLYKGEADVIK